MTDNPVHDLCARFYDKLVAVPLEGPTRELAIQVLDVVESLRDAHWYPDDAQQLADAIREARDRIYNERRIS